MKVSVIVPNYNHAIFLYRRLDSILRQTYSDFEIIILDDCSTDGSRNIIEQYRSNPKVSNIIYNETNSGTGFMQWVKGLRTAKGELVWIAESDDWCDSNFLETLVNGMEKNPSCVLGFAQSYCVDNINNVQWQSHTSEPEEVIAGDIFFERRLVYGCTIFNASMAIFKRRVALLVPENFTFLKLCGDWFFWINMVRFGDVYVSNKVLNYYRRTESSLTSRLYSSGYNFIEELSMFRMIKEQKMDKYFCIHDSIFNRYNSFQRNKNKFTMQQVQDVYKAFYDFFGGFFLFSIFLFYKKSTLTSKKIRVRVKLVIQNFKAFKLL